MKKSFNQKKWEMVYVGIWVIAHIFICTICIDITSPADIAVIATIQLFINMMLILFIQHTLLSISIMFLIFSYVLHLGQFALLLLGEYAVVPTANIFERVSEETLVYAARYILYAHTFVALGILLSSAWKTQIKIKRRVCIYDRGNISANGLCLAGVILFVIGIIPSMYINFKKIQLMREGGYYNTFGYTAQTGGIIFFISNLWQIGVMLFFAAYHDRIWRCRILYLFSVGYLAVSMLTGGRITALMYIVTISLMYFEVIEKITWKKSLLMGGVGLLGINYVVNIGLSRNSAGMAGFKLEESFLTVLAKVLAEFGGAMHTLALTLEHIPIDTPFAYGKTYLYSLIMLMPNLGWPDRVVSAIRYVDYIKEYTTSGLGGSYIGEVYFNFGLLGIPFFALIGFGLGRLDRLIRSSIKAIDWIRLITILGVVPYVFIWTRSYFKDMVRPLVWQAILLLILYKVFQGERIDDFDNNSGL